MFDISALKEMKLSELQEIAKTAKTIKFNGVKKETLIGQILEHQVASNTPKSVEKEDSTTEDDKPKRVRIVPLKKGAIQKNTNDSLFSEAEVTIESEPVAIETTQRPE